jgi:toxin ParE1/3/4
VKRHFVLSDQAEADIDACAEYLAHQSIELGARFYDATWSTLESLADTPAKGRLREFAGTDLAQVRSWPISGFEAMLVFYVPVDSGIRVLRVLRGARDIDTEFERP